MTHWTIVPVVLPALTAALLVLLGANNLPRQRAVSVVSMLLLVGTTLLLFVRARQGELLAYALGDWPAPYGIILVADRLSALMLVLAGFVATVVLLYSINGWDTRGRHFHVLFHFQILGINGAFLAGDLFNLFVFFEVMLIASYGLMLHGGGARRLRAGFQYVTVNIVGSVVFLFAVGLIYGVTGTLNLADLAVKVPQVAAADRQLLVAGAVLLLGVFVLKAALVPLHWWLPIAYSAAPPPAAALFAILTKVGAYAIIRVFNLVFPGTLVGLGDGLLVAALVTLVVGAVGTLASRKLLDFVCYAVIASMGTLLIPLALFRADAIATGLYYLIHSTVIACALFLLVDLLAERRGSAGDQLTAAPMRQRQLGAGLFLVAAIAFVGMPPLAGFIGKLLILDTTRSFDHGPVIWVMVLATSFLLLISFARAGSVMFWKSSGRAAIELPAVLLRRAPVLCLLALLAATALQSAFAGWIAAELDAVAQQVSTPEIYLQAVLRTAANAPGG